MIWWIKTKDRQWHFTRGGVGNMGTRTTYNKATGMLTFEDTSCVERYFVNCGADIPAGDVIDTSYDEPPGDICCRPD